MEPVSTYKILGIICGFVFGLLLAVVIISVNNKTKDGVLGKFEYDERQQIIQGKSFRFGFLAAVIYSGLLTLLSICNVPFPAIDPVMYFSVLFVGAIAMSSYSIWHDAYWGLNTNKKGFIICMSVVTLVNFIVPVRFMIDGSFIKDGKAGLSAVNLLCGIIFLAILLQDIIKKAVVKKSDEEEDDE